MDFQDSVQEAEYKLQVKADFRWKDKQLECLQAVFNGKDILAVLPTGYGKSMVFQAAPFMPSCLTRFSIIRLPYYFSLIATVE